MVVVLEEIAHNKRRGAIVIALFVLVWIGIGAAAGALFGGGKAGPVLDSGRYPAFARWLRGRTPAGAAGQFDYTLGWLLDGIAAHLA